jgi:hypothetical protein
MEMSPSVCMRRARWPSRRAVACTQLRHTRCSRSSASASCPHPYPVVDASPIEVHAVDDRSTT